MCAFAILFPAAPMQHLQSRRSGFAFCSWGETTPLDKDSNFTADATVGFFLSGCGSLMKALRLFPGLKELEDAQKILNAMNIHLPLCFSRSYALC